MFVCVSSQMKFSSGKNLYIKKLEFQAFEPGTYQLSTYALRIMLFRQKKSSFGDLLRLSFTRFHLAPGHDFEKNHGKMVILKWYLNFPTWHQIFKKMPKKARCRLCFWNTLLLAWFLKNHVKMVNLKILPPLPNLTSNFETHKNVGDNFWLYI